MYFVDDEHKNNYKNLLEIFPLAKVDVEYQVACYITAVPMVFYKIADDVYHFEYPLDWIVNWNSKYMSRFDDETLEEYEERTNIDVDYDLTFSMQQLGRLGLNLFNGYEHFNLMRSINSLDDENMLVLKTAIDVRLGHFKGQ